MAITPVPGGRTGDSHRPFYNIDYSCRDDDELQRLLNDLYGYANDFTTKIQHRGRLNLFSAMLGDLIRRKVITAFDSAIDFGCNSRVFSKIISDYGFGSVLGVDIEPNCIDRANRNFACHEAQRTIRFEIANAENPDITSRYDFISCTEVIEHTAHPAVVIQNISAMPAPEGIAVVTLPNRISLPFLLTVISYILQRKPIDSLFREHLNYPFYRALRLFDGSGLRVIKTSGTNLFFAPLPARLLKKTPLFAPLHRLDSRLSKLWPCKYFTQFFFIVLRRQAP